MNTTEFEIYFDGGTEALKWVSDGVHLPTQNGYGSWEVRWNGFSKKVSRVQFLAAEIGQRCTNNVAEYLSLIGALEWIQTVKSKEQFTVKIHGDSQLVLYTLMGYYKTKKPHLKVLRDRARKLLNGFSAHKIQWQKRHHNVERFGH